MVCCGATANVGYCNTAVGSQTATLAFGRSGANNTEEYNGTAWAAGGDLILLESLYLELELKMLDWLLREICTLLIIRVQRI